MAGVHEEAEIEVGEACSVPIPAPTHEAKQDGSLVASIDKKEEGPEATVHNHKPPALQDRAQTVHQRVERCSLPGGTVQAGLAPDAKGR